MAIKIAGTIVIDNNKKFIGTSIDVSGNSDANGFRINGTTVIDSNRKLTNIADGSAELSFSGSSLVLSVGGAQQDTQELDDTHTHDTRYIQGSCCSGTLNNDTGGNPYGECSPGVDKADVKAFQGLVRDPGGGWLAAISVDSMGVYLNSRAMYTSSSKCQILVFGSAWANREYSCCAFE